ncbi:MAG: hypothetical protein RMI92_11065 [Geminocystis sp.]|nr:hypothetical protein [Geminocystis sp.]
MLYLPYFADFCSSLKSHIYVNLLGHNDYILKNLGNIQALVLSGQAQLIPSTFVELPTPKESKYPWKITPIPLPLPELNWLVFRLTIDRNRLNLLLTKLHSLKDNEDLALKENFTICLEEEFEKILRYLTVTNRLINRI